ncbi:hypothetical protein O6H91_02G077000 [Diphasiastrum complanatum]|uniref:Uncharacterized protein n=1 Tax=Diphasiastrum complanatum TaxID=34168 RepID=A0ACC2EHH6_DIPCM|nr:hypothetical protein O6H91_Y542300 [Diphasiastrum complanatum]KAJ7565840.1 hypothetical protein O6H91_02G077000 [Diphasiastrum complanatum]
MAEVIWSGGMVVVLLLFTVFSTAISLRVGYYSESCPWAEYIVHWTVAAHANNDPTIAAGLLRMHFHDCFVQGCDASVLLDSTPSGAPVEKEGLPNKNSLRGFEVIDDAKTHLEVSCPGVVSCADVVALAARDAVFLSDGPYYDVPTGRLDGRISLASEANSNVPSPFLSADGLKAAFAKKGLSVYDLVHLSGAHTIGRAHCAVFVSRLFNFNNTGSPDPSLNSAYRNLLRATCPQSGSPNPLVSLDRGSQFRFDNSYYNNLLSNAGLLLTDQELNQDSVTKGSVHAFARDEDHFFVRFTESMIKMGKIDLKTRQNGEVRLQCNAINNSTLSEEDVSTEETIEVSTSALDTKLEESGISMTSSI